MRVLVVDDEPFQLKLLCRQLANLGVKNTVALTDARVALAQLQADPTAFDLVCCDLQMPEMDGVEFVRHLGLLGYKGGLVLVSGEHSRILQSAERLARAHALQVKGALHKPITPEQLRQVVVACEPAAPAPTGAATPAARPPERQFTVDELRYAIQNNQLVNHYQPKVEIATGRVAGFETLVRWQHPECGLIYPDRFIGMAEQHGLIDNLTRSVLAGLGGALQQAKRWQQEGRPVPVAVNVSMDNLVDHSFPAFVLQELDNAGLPASRLTLEVTESRLMTDALATLDIVTRLRLKRVGLSIDDFGTGHSSLQQLRDMPFDELKVDRGFIHRAYSQESLRAIVQPSLMMARQLGMKTVAEGVEDLQDWIFVRDSGCDIAQGYFIGRPMPAAGVAAWWAEWEARRGALLMQGSGAAEAVLGKPASAAAATHKRSSLAGA
jgi:EAL domain-containing protein (putative c-di-GMP-specific phosphodiesterase class I)/ActR/RegA family two-component response regulator